MKSKFSGAVFVFILISQLMIGMTWAEDTPGLRGGGDEAKVFKLGEVVVRGDAASNVTDVDTADAEWIKLTTSENVSDALDTLPGVNISVGAKNERNIVIRGFNERYVPIFFDGIPIYIPNDGYVDAGRLSTGNISKITLTKGNSSVIYGPNTMGGVVNIITRKPQKPFESEFILGLSENDAFESFIRLGSRKGRFYFTADGSMIDSDGWELSDDFVATANENGGLRENSYRDAHSGSMKIGFMPADGHEYAAGINVIRSESGFPPDIYAARPRYWRFTDWEKRTYYFIGDTRVTDRFNIKTRVFRDEYYNVLDSYDNNTFTTQRRPFAFHSTYNDYSNGLSVVLNSRYLKKNDMKFSFHYKDDVHREQDDYGALWEKYESEMFSYGLEDSISIRDCVTLVLGASYDKQNPKFAHGQPVREDEGVWNPQAGLNYTGFEDTSMYVSVGKKTRFPTMQELYSGLLGRNRPNPTLASEEALNYQVGVDRFFPKDTSAGLALFYSDLENKIVNKEVAPGVDQFQNIGEAVHKGFEVTLKSGFLENNQFELHYTYLDAKNRSAERTSDYLEETPRHILYISDLYKMNDWLSFFSKLQWNSKRYYESTTTNEWTSVKGFWTVDAKLIGQLHKHLTFEFGAKNIFDENYQFVEGYPREGRAFFGKLIATF